MMLFPALRNLLFVLSLAGALSLQLPLSSQAQGSAYMDESPAGLNPLYESPPPASEVVPISKEVVKARKRKNGMDVAVRKKSRDIFLDLDDGDLQDEGKARYKLRVEHSESLVPGAFDLSASGAAASGVNTATLGPHKARIIEATGVQSDDTIIAGVNTAGTVRVIPGAWSVGRIVLTFEDVDVLKTSENGRSVFVQFRDYKEWFEANRSLAVLYPVLTDGKRIFADGLWVTNPDSPDPDRGHCCFVMEHVLTY